MMKLKERLLFLACLIVLLVPFVWLRMTEMEERNLQAHEKNIRLLEVTDHLDFNSMEHGHGVLIPGVKKHIALRKENHRRDLGIKRDTIILKDTNTNINHQDQLDTRSENDESDSDDDDENDNDMEAQDPWQTWKDMVQTRQLTQKGKQEVNMILDALTYKPVVAAGVGYRGTQLKATLLLEGNQKVVFKPGRYSRGHVITGKPYDGYDRHNGEIAAFHLDRILGFNRAPPVAGRLIDLQDEIQPIAEKSLLKTFFKKDGNTCFYGICRYCKREEPACANKTSMEGSMTIWLPPGWSLSKWRHPWQRTYTNRKAKWEKDNNYCKRVILEAPYDEGPRLLDIIDTAIFDFLIGNADRHHYETFKKGGDEGMLIHLDNAKSFGNPDQDELSILAPLYQCCRIRKSTWERLTVIFNNKSKPLGQVLKESTDADALAPILSSPHLKAVERRLGMVIDIVSRCIKKNSKKNVIKKDAI